MKTDSSENKDERWNRAFAGHTDTPSAVRRLEYFLVPNAMLTICKYPFLHEIHK
jgi:hypothetical protein